MKEKKEFVEETMEQKRTRWDKQTKAAKAMAKQCGFNIKKLAKERARYEAERRMHDNTQFF
jgi:hypothetical protein